MQSGEGASMVIAPSNLIASARVARLLAEAEARGRVRWQSSARAYRPLPEAAADPDRRADVETVATLLTDLRRAWESRVGA
jgi:hypothetical protein